MCNIYISTNVYYEQSCLRNGSISVFQYLKVEIKSKGKKKMRRAYWVEEDRNFLKKMHRNAGVIST